VEKKGRGGQGESKILSPTIWQPYRDRASQAAQLHSSVLTTIGLVNGNPSLLTPTQSTSLNLSLKNLSQVITCTTSTAVQILVEIHPWGASGQIGEI